MDRDWIKRLAKQEISWRVLEEVRAVMTGMLETVQLGVGVPERDREFRR